MQVVKLSKRGLEADVKAGLKRSEIAAKYNLPLSSLQKAFKQAGLTGMRAQNTAFELVDDEEIVDFDEVPQPTSPEVIHSQENAPEQD